MRTPTTIRLLPALALLALSAGCGSAGEPIDPPNHPWVQEARAEFPDAIALHTKVIARSCSPNGGVCHNTREYPDLHTPGNFVTAVSKPCNLDVDDPAQVFDGCEPEGDTIEIDDGSQFRTRLAWFGPDEYDPQTGSSYRAIRLEAAASKSTRTSGRILRGGSVIAELPSIVVIQDGSRDARLVDTYMLDYPVWLALQTVRGGDPNGNGVFGGNDGWAEIVPGRPERSYLVSRLLGTVPGSRMPLANQALSNPEYVALICWIESIGSRPHPEDRIDYDRCDYARDPADHAGTGFPARPDLPF